MVAENAQDVEDQGYVKLAAAEAVKADSKKIVSVAHLIKENVWSALDLNIVGLVTAQVLSDN